MPINIDLLNKIKIMNQGGYDLFIASFYFGIDKFPAVSLKAPYRKDVKPSLGLQYYNGRVLYKDFSTGESGTIVALLSKTWGLSEQETIYKIIHSINSDKVHIEKGHSVNTSNKIVYSNIKIISKEWSTEDLNYWNQYGITKKWLKFADIIPILYFYINGFPHKADTLAYAYRFYDGKNFRYKIYQPLNTKNKWYGNYDNTIINLSNKLQKVDTSNIILCSSLKDALCTWATTKVPCISLQSECMKIPDVCKDILTRFKHAYILYDNDTTGLKQGEKLAKENDLINIIIPKFEGGKDISDLYKIKGKEAVINLINSYIYES